MHVIIQPRDGITPLLDGINQATESVEIVIYRLDLLEIELALVEAAARGLRVHALITYTNKEDLPEIKKLEKRLTERKVTVTRTAEDLIRYHSKVMIIDRRKLYLLTFNFTFLDIHHSRSFGVIAEDPHLVAEAVQLFSADVAGKTHKAGSKYFVISPNNARQKLSEFILGARKQLLIYDGKLNDSQILKLLANRARAGVEIKVIGQMGKKVKGIDVRPMPLIRLHAQAIIRDGKEVFFGSQSLRKPELDHRREVGLITKNLKAVKSFFLIFVMDWGDLVTDLTEED